MPAVSVAGVSYGCGALAFLALTVLTVRGAHNRARGTALRSCFTLAVLATALACLAAALWLPQSAIGTALQDQLAQSSSLCWIFFLLQQLGRPQGAGIQRWLLPALWLGLTGLALSHNTLAWVIRLSSSLLGMILVEQLFRASPARRWNVKYMCIGLGLMFAFDFYLYSDALLLQRMDPQFWRARGALLAVCAVPLGLGLRRFQAATAHWQLSRQILAGSVAMLGAAIYLLLMAAMAWYLRAIGGPWGVLMQLVCLAGAVLLLLTTLFSGAARAWLRVWIAKHFYRGHYDYRRVWQQLSGDLSNSTIPLHERTIQALARLVDSPAGVLWLASEQDGYALALSWNMAAPAHRWTADLPACQLMAQRGWVLDARSHGWPQLYCVVPLRFEQHLIGMVGLAPPRVSLALDWERRDLLKSAGVQVASYLAQAAAAEKLATERQFATVHRMSSFIAHDVKNLAAQLALLLENSRRHQDKPEFQRDLLETLTHSVGRMQSLLVRLQAQSWNAAAPASCPPVQLEALLACLLERYQHCRPRPALHIGAAPLWIQADPEALSRIIGHLIQNALDATPPEGAISLTLQREGACAVITVKDSGCGMSAQYMRQRLFQPFVSSKAGGMGIGVYECREYALQLDGRLDVESAPAQGTSFHLRLPLQQTVAAA